MAPAPWSAVPILTAPFDRGRLAWTPHGPAFSGDPLPLFSYALRVGAPWSHALDLFAGLPDGFFSVDGRVFALPALHEPLGTPDRCIALADPGDSEALTLFFGPAGLVAIASSHSLLPRPSPSPAAGLILSPRGHTHKLASLS